MDVPGQKLSPHCSEQESRVFLVGADILDPKAGMSMISQRQSITSKGVHAHPLTAREREHWFLQHPSHFLVAKFGRQ